MDEPLAHPSSLLGQLQRGRGMGFLAALDAPPTVVAPLLLECIIYDPRWDAQLEQRADYYALLPLSPPRPPLRSWPASLSPPGRYGPGVAWRN